MRTISWYILTVLIVLVITTPATLGWGSREPPYIKLVPLGDYEVANLSYYVLVKPLPLIRIDFDWIGNESLKYIVGRTQYSAGITIPSNRVYVKDGWLILRNTHHLILFPNIYLSDNKLARQLLDNLTVYVIIVKYLGGYNPRYARGGVGLYSISGVVEDEKGVYFTIANYWISVLGAFRSDGSLSYDFEGHWVLGGYRWMYSEAVSRLFYRVNETYALWIARVGDYIVGGIIVLDNLNNSELRWTYLGDLLHQSRWVFYIRDIGSWPGLVSWSASIAIKRIEVYSLKPIHIRQIYKDGRISVVKPEIHSRTIGMLRYDRTIFGIRYYWFKVVNIDLPERKVYYRVKVITNRPILSGE